MGSSPSDKEEPIPSRRRVCAPCALKELSAQLTWPDGVDYLRGLRECSAQERKGQLKEQDGFLSVRV